MANTKTPKTKPYQWPKDAPALAIAPFDAKQAKQHQEAWAKYLGVPVEKEVVLGNDKRGLEVKLTMVLIPPGEFLMGSNDDEIANLRKQAKANGLNHWDFKWIDLEGPQRRVRITRPFYVGRTEITTAQFRSFVQAANYRTEAESSGKGSWRSSKGKMVMDPKVNWQSALIAKWGDAPVTHVTWNDANACCKWLSNKHRDLTFALPTEAQWEYACRAGTTTAWCCGDDEALLKEYGIVNSKKAMFLVGRKKPNAFGLCDMHGNVWEWCRDSLYDYRDAEKTDPVGPSGEKRILRGGNCFGHIKSDWHNSNGCRSAVRYEARSDHRVMDRGSRVVAALPDDFLRAAANRNAKSARPKDAPTPAIAPFVAEQAQKYQEAWAKHLGVPVEYENSIGMKFRLIPPGEFMMGSKAGEIKAALKGANDPRSKICIRSEGPQHKVVLTRPIYVGVTELTQSQYKRVMGRNPSAFSAKGKNKNFKKAVAGLDTSNHPVEMVSWNDAAEFCAKLSQQEKLKPYYFRSGQVVRKLEGTGYRLPTEAEWEFACRAGTVTRFWSGDKVKNLFAAGWFRVNLGARTHAAGELKANPFGLFDVHGNVWEWVQDRFDPEFYENFADKTAVDPYQPFTVGSPHVFRGGSAWDLPFSSRSSHRFAFKDFIFRSSFLGFRVVLPVDAVKPSPSATGSYALAFDGTSNTSVEFPTLNKFEMKDALTIEAFVRVHSSKWMNIVGANSASKNGIGHFSINRGSYFGTGDCYVKGKSRPTNTKLIHVAGVYDGKSMALFVDGVLQNRNTSPISRPAGGAMQIGGKELTPQFSPFDGIIREVRISTVARYTKDFAPAKRLPADEHTLALYHFDEGQGDALNDSSGNGHHGKIVGAKWVSMDVIAPLSDDEAGRIAALPAAEQFKEVVDKLKRRNPRFKASTARYVEKDGAIVELSFLSDHVIDISPVRALRGLQTLNCSGTLEGKEWGRRGQSPLADLNSLRGLNLTSLDCSGTEVADLSPLQGMPLEHLNLSGTPVKDLSAVDSQRLTLLNIAHSQVSDAALAHFKDCKNLTHINLGWTQVGNAGLAHFKGCKNLSQVWISGTKVDNLGVRHFQDCKKLTHFACGKTKVTDLSPLKGMPLLVLWCDWRVSLNNSDTLRSLKTLRKIGDMSTDEFWKRVGKK